MTSMVVARRIVVRGRVQGVWFRDSCRREADRLGVRGWARNLDDGAVEVVAAGDTEAVAALEHWCHTGPPWALVTRVDAADVDLPPSATGFAVR